MDKPYRSVITENERVTRRSIKARAAEKGMSIQDYLTYAVELELTADIATVFNNTSDGALGHHEKTPA